MRGVTMRRSWRGFTLVELMAVVAIVAVLAVVATFSYKRYMRRTRIMEGTSFLMDIQMKQESYFMTYSRYVDTGANSDDFYPANGDFQNKKLPITWGWNCAATGLATGPTGFCLLGIVPQSPYTYFQYVTIGWQPGKADPSTDYIRDPTKRWWYARARTYPDDTTGTSVELRLSSELQDIVELDM